MGNSACTGGIKPVFVEQLPVIALLEISPLPDIDGLLVFAWSLLPLLAI
jgi:hypothetical protein